MLTLRNGALQVGLWRITRLITFLSVHEKMCRLGGLSQVQHFSTGPTVRRLMNTIPHRLRENEGDDLFRSVTLPMSAVPWELAFRP